ncbi:Activator of Hsp90 ATPase 1 family protein OS=Tsukamurella paurometabola (strain ATCC 8368 / DSM/ CCUG 35730 / CIP 100753 / JCM 10117 / KCTC 9821 / NBRC 16120 / NCIMB 702349 / NCTC 13040) OX=521096 GN=Tpau_4022 PE=3 SV=1 [Tsukamurella paurometabola]|uniref:Activator of Hsp90 ATPase 1 family protein n=1 Tax=Tsukamurella paurometabola (strain ATCC 8368 / DSM 20162 / CCUG 35730 / CIP 100753 / JCM 10117 / KCTC 9821 / NBRC 16120 / NCIMB 702349 / NCTC 13040) TaxID=521096 RepID=D5UN98_TSUPD|nr:SRPBCC domain-containing protein [Tsukamurella paurometabola]ADG80593.1 Activator of Hsp90 ATPase 1 family protein [Tsukamurella paurometabola DSM 20162]SUP40214.1 Activator of Hsp90 ATPase homolog 1-like protein [Tsukamurella paurometabola]
MFEIERDRTAVELDMFMAASPETVWRALTEPDLMERWCARPVGLRAQVGSTFILEIPSDPPGEVSCEVVTADPARRFTHSYTDLRAARPMRWMVDFTLVPEGTGTRVLLVFSGFDIDDRQQAFARNAVERGWSRTLFPRLGAVVADLAG